MNGIPVLHVEADCIARAWEESLIALHREGVTIKTQYDKADDPPSKDATMIITITDPLREPMIHKDFPGGPEDLQEYTLEVCEASRTIWFVILTILPIRAGNIPTISASSLMKCPRCNLSTR